MLLNGRYEYNPATDLIGRGGLAEVFKAYDRQRGKYVALKKFNVADNLKYGIREEFQKSINFAHGNIVRAYDFFTIVQEFVGGGTHETQYGVMELIEGGDLADYLKKKSSNEELLEVVKGILRGLEYLHTPDPNTDKGRIIHRDIKPGNILIYYNHEGKPIPKIADFNVAKELSTTTESSISIVGTYEYMAPEQLNVTKYGMDHHIHPNADLWAVGVILCDYFMGKSLFGKRSEGNTQGQIIGNILEKPIPVEAIKKLPAPFNGIIARCLVRKAKDRVMSGADLLTWLKSFEEKTIVTPPLKLQSPSVKSKTDRDPILNVVSVLLLLLLLGLGIYAFLTSPLLYITTLITNTPSIFDDQMILIKGGTFMMGSPDTEADRENDEYQHRVTVSSFKMSKYEVTQSQWHTITGENPSFFDGCKFCPVEQISYDDIQKFLLKLNTKSAKKYRLPTEAEWEYAARGGNQSRNFKFAGSNNLSEVGWYYENSGEKRLNEKDWSANNAQSNNCRTHPVGDKAPNELGLYDMSGNVWEWCSDWYDSNYYENSPVDNPKGPAIGLKRVLRGGSWNYDALNCRTTFRDYNTPDSRHNNFGFRLVSDP